MIFHIFICIPHFLRVYYELKMLPARSGLIAQSVEHCTGTTEVMGWNLVQAWIFFSSFNFTLPLLYLDHTMIYLGAYNREVTCLWWDGMGLCINRTVMTSRMNRLIWIRCQQGCKDISRIPLLLPFWLSSRSRCFVPARWRSWYQGNQQPGRRGIRQWGSHRPGTRWKTWRLLRILWNC